MPKISAATVAEHRVRTRELLLDAIDSLVIERPFESITMRDVAARAGVTRTAIYNYAPDTITLLTEATQRGSAAVRAAVVERAEDAALAPSERLRSIVTVLLLDYAKTTSTFLAVRAIRTFDEDHFTAAVEPFRADVGDFVIDVVRAGVAAGEFSRPDDFEITLALMVGVMHTALQRIYEVPESREAVAEAAAQFLINGLRGPQPGDRP
jgi:AcrR family transcriptional regulator